MRRLAFASACASALVLPLIPAAPALAADNVICVGAPVGTCSQTVASIQAAIVVANANSVADTILVGPGTYTDGPYQLTGSAHAVTLRGSGQGSTVLTLAASASNQVYVQGNNAAVQELTVEMASTNSANDTGIRLFDGSADHVTVTGEGTADAIAIHSTNSQVSHATAEMSLVASGRAFYSESNNSVSDSSLTGYAAYVLSGSGTDHLSRLSIRAGSGGGVGQDSGTINVDDTLIDLGSSGGTGLRAANFNNSTSPKTINADHVTIVGGGGSSKGAWAYAGAPGALQTSNIVLTNSIVRGPETDLVADASNNGAQGGSSVGTVTVSHTDYHSTGGTLGANGSGGVVAGVGNLDVDPQFVDAVNGDYRLALGSPVVDQGAPGAGGPALDLDGDTRVVDGDGNGSAVRDLGAFELHDTTAPQTTVLTGPGGPTADSTPTFTFGSEAGATFECRIDGQPFAACSGPGSSHTTAALGEGAHTFRVRATDAAANTDATPASRAFKVDTLAPQTSIKSKPAKRVASRKVKFSFSSTEPGARYRCKLDGGAWRRCASPATFRVKLGKHRLSVRATDTAGNTDTTPATYRFTRVRRR